MKILFVVLLLAVVAQVPSCESGDRGPIVGFVEDKYLTDVGGPRSQPAIVIRAQEYIVPMQFYREVDVGDLVRFENGRWIIVRKGRSLRDPGAPSVSISVRS